MHQDPSCFTHSLLTTTSIASRSMCLGDQRDTIRFRTVNGCLHPAHEKYRRTTNGSRLRQTETITLPYRAVRNSKLDCNSTITNHREMMQSVYVNHNEGNVASRYSISQHAGLKASAVKVSWLSILRSDFSALRFLER